MRLYAEQLQDNLKAGLKPCYLVFGDEPLQKQECLDAIRQAAAAQGYTERHSYTLDDNPEWQQIEASCHAMSLFTSRQIIELELGEKLPRDWAEKCQSLANALHPDLLLILFGPRLSAAQTKAKWFDNLSRQGVYIPINFPDSRFFPRWMQQRAQLNGLKLQPDAVQFMCHAFEGNLLGAAQELEKLALLNLSQPLGLLQLQENVTRQNHFTPFQFIDTLLDGKVNRAQRMLLQLRGEGVEAGMLAWALARELEQLLMLRLACDHGQALGPLLEKARVWSSRQALYQQALQRLTTERLHQLIAVTVQLDRAIRRFETEEAWLLLQSLSLGFRHDAALKLVSA
ncbi:DNA polymerase III subunit delta [Pseudaeromonas sharmana]|uniref:DNA polymerase III subunit delta n=1 Tax=Pseudaeromonas sharmana TaxID=328412 RepID=A0ABV8CIY1_9GAMM